VARASGVRRDLRKDDPCLCYAPDWDGAGAEPVKFNVPISTDGDCLSRYMVRLEELHQSVGIIEQLIDNIPSGPIDTLADSKARIPDKADVYGSIEGTIQLFELLMHNRGIDSPVGEYYGSIESPNGELGYYIVANGTHYPWRARTRPPSFLNFSVMARLVEGHLVSDVVAVLGSLNIIAAELDR
jgi:NADH-quinone oxidoreductase subunit D